ncbi:MAG: ParB/RepB/Spo0J family partition protein [Oscillospiraceae bacterium]|nr:ParB/RepB/Spo0J family partition protein [Oscillospiraceae bacterium]
MNTSPPRAEYLPIDKLRPFDGHPFQVKDDAEMDQLVFSVLTQGLLTPITVRATDTDEYEVISGHRRLRACQKAGIETVPALIYSMDRDAAIIALVDSNLHREHLLPSEKAHAYKMKMDAISHQGASCQLGTKLRSDEIIGSSTGESARQVQRYIRLTNLIPDILQMVDQGRIALTPAVELSYLTESEQQDLLETMESEDCTPSLSQSQQLKKLSQSGELDMDRIFELMRQPKANQEEKLRFDMKDIRRYFPKNYSTEKIQQTILRLLEKYERNWRRNRDER